MYEGSLFSTSLPTFVFCVLFDDSHFDRCEVIWYPNVVLVCISLMISNIERLFMCLLTIYISSLEICLFNFAHFFNAELYDMAWSNLSKAAMEGAQGPNCWLEISDQGVWTHTLWVIVSMYVYMCLLDYNSKAWRGFSVGSVVQNPPASAGNVGLIPALERSSGEGNGNPLQYSCLGNPMDTGAWATVHGVVKES